MHKQTSGVSGIALMAALGLMSWAVQAGEAKTVSETRTNKSPGMTTYYVDAAKGDDANPGTSPEKPWKSLARPNSTSFAPGDKLLFAAGQTCGGTLRLAKDSSGTKDEPIVISSYGDGRATLDAGTANGVELHDCAFVVVRGLQLIGCGRKQGSDGSGIVLRRTRNAAVDDLDVSGFRLSGVDAGGDESTRITRVNAHDNGFAGINVCGKYGDVPFTRNLYIAHCVASNNPGDPKKLDNHSGNGIVVGGLQGGLIEYCEAFNNGWDMPRQGNGPVGIWGWGCDRLVIQFCISHDNKTQKGAYDGGGFDFDGGVTNSVLQYNLSYNNHGAGYLLCQYPGAALWKDNVCRYNISLNDALTNHDSGIHFWAGGDKISDAQVYHNVVVNGKHAVKSTHDIAGLVFRNNIFISDGESVSGPLHKARFENNLYWPRKVKTVCGGKTLEGWAQAAGQETVAGKLAALCGDPKIVLPQKLTELPTNPRDLAKMRFFRLEAGSPCPGAGTVIPDHGGRDFFGNAVPAGRKPALGVHEPAENR